MFDCWLFNQLHLFELLCYICICYANIKLFIHIIFPYPVMPAGDVLMITAFVSYVGSFTKRYRTDLFEYHLTPFLKGLKHSVPVSDGLDPLTMLIDDADIAGWNNEGLPSDRMSTENATILTNCERWPLMIDPQLQGIKWIKTRYGSDLKV